MKGPTKFLKKNFPDSVIDGSYFHFVKLLWSKAKSLGLFKKSDLKLTKIILFILKIIPFTKEDDKNKIFQKVEDFVSLQDDK